jgi:hypothetical protein
LSIVFTFLNYLAPAPGVQGGIRKVMGIIYETEKPEKSDIFYLFFVSVYPFLQFVYQLA